MSKPDWSLALHETIAHIENRTVECLRGCVRGDPFLASFILNTDEVRRILCAGASDLFKAQAEYFESHSRFRRSWLGDVISETLDRIFDLVPLALSMSFRYKEALPAIRKDVVRTLHICLDERREPASVLRVSVPGADTPNAPVRVLGSQPRGGKSFNGSVTDVRQNRNYMVIDQALRSIAEAMPRNHAEVFQFLDDRQVRLPYRKLFGAAGGWVKGYKAYPSQASSWLSQRWRHLGLPAFPRGPKPE